MPTVRDFLSFDAFAEVASHYAISEIDEPWRRRARDLERRLLQPALNSFLRAMRAEGRLQPVDQRGHEIPLIENWNHFIAAPGGDEEDFALARVADWLTRRLFLGLRKAGQDGIDRMGPYYDSFTRLVDQGDFRWFDGMAEQLTCLRTDERFIADIQDWKFTVGTWKRGSHDLDPIQPTDAGTEVKVLPFEVKGTELLMADWFRIPGFTEALERGFERPSVNSTEGRERTTEFYASRRVISVCVGNSSPDVLESKDGLLSFGYVDDLLDVDPDLVSKGSICTDLWWVTALEKETLIDLVADGADRAEASSKVEEYLRSNEVVRVPVTPGTHYLYFSGDYDRFSEMFASPDVVGTSPPALFLLSPTELALKQPQADATNPRMR